MGITSTKTLVPASSEKATAPRRHHEKFSPSSFPAMDECPCYKSKEGGSSDAAERGNKLHEQLSEILQDEKEV